MRKTHKKAEEEFDRQAASLLDEVLTIAVMVVLLLGVGWGIGVILAYVL